MNLTTRMQARGFTRLTNGFSNKLEYHLHAVALHVLWFNVCHPHAALSHRKQKVTLAMAAPLADRVCTAEEVLALLGLEKAEAQARFIAGDRFL